MEKRLFFFLFSFSIIAVAAVFLISFFNFLFGQCKGKKFQDPLDLALLFVGGEVISFKRLYL